MKIALHLPVWKRLELTRACYVGLQRSIQEFKEEGLDLEPWIGWTEPKHKDLADEFGWNTVECTNENLGLKNQQLYEAMRVTEFDYFMQLGSDDFFLPGVAKVYKEHMKEYEFAGFRQIYFLRAKERDGTLMQGYPCGAGRYMSRRIIDACPKLWFSRKRGLDGMSMDFVNQATGLKCFYMPGCYLADVKTEVGISEYHRYDSDMYYLDDIIPEAYLI